MRLQRETDYALRCILCLALKKTESIRANELAHMAGAPEQMLKKLVTKLQRAGLVETRPGPGGGVSLTKQPKEISVYDVVRCIEGPLCLNQCLGADGYCSRGGILGCGVHQYLKEFQDEIEASMRGMTFDKILERNHTSAQHANVQAAGHLCPVAAAKERYRPCTG